MNNVNRTDRASRMDQMDPGRKSRLKRNIILWMVVGFLLSLSYCLHIDICLFHRITGWNCPGCGATHMILALLRGEIWQAFWYNPVLLILLPALCVVIGDIYIRFLKTGFIVSRPWERGLLIMMGVCLIVFGVVRNLPAYPMY